MTPLFYFETFAAEKIHRLYEQKLSAPERVAALDDYLTRWVRWTTAGLKELDLNSAFPAAYAEARQAETN